MESEHAHIGRSTYSTADISHLRTQRGSCPVHPITPSPWSMQVRVEVPCSVNPALQLYIATESTVCVTTVTRPLDGAVSAGHREAGRRKNVILMTRVE